MALHKLQGFAIRGMSACVPKQVLDNHHYQDVVGRDLERVIKAIGIERRRVALPEQCTSDMCVAATPPLLESLGWSPDDVGALVLMTITGDYKQPPTACILQHRLGLPKHCLAFDINLGCSGYLYGIYTLASMMLAGGIKRGLMMAGDTAVRGYSERDMTGYLINGDAATVTALELDPTAAPFTFDLGTDGSGYAHILQAGGASRVPFDENSLIYKDVGDGNWRRPIDTALNGSEVFAFAIRRVPETIGKVLKATETTLPEIDYFVLHQASHLVVEFIRRKMGIPKEKLPYSMTEFGNPGSATIPLTIVTQLANQYRDKTHKTLMCGFGMGLSWATCQTQLGNLVCPPLVEL